MTHTYATLTAVKASLSADDPNAADDLLLSDYLRRATAMIEQYCGRSFVPTLATRTYDALGDPIDGIELSLNGDLLAAVSITNGDSTTITAAQYTLRPANITPKHSVRLLATSGTNWTYSTNYEDAISLAGVWGYHESYTDAWVNTWDAVADVGGINASVQTITVADADGMDARYRARFQAGQIIRIGSEYCIVVAVTAGSTNTLTVLRGQLGTTADVHAAATAINSYAVMYNIEQACLSLAVWLYRNRTTQGDKIQFLDGSSVITNIAPSHIKDTLRGYVKP